MCEITLSFDKSLTKLAGNPFGRSTYNNQAKSLIDFEQQIHIIFPDQIDNIASSFVQGFFEDIVFHIGIEGVAKNVDVTSSIPDLKAFIVNNLE